MTQNKSIREQTGEPPETTPQRPRWLGILMVAGSALLGGTAVALWNRRALMAIRRRSPAYQQEPLDAESHLAKEDSESET